VIPLDKSRASSARGVERDNDDFVAVVPYWAIWPFELILISKSHRERLTDLTRREASSLAQILQRIVLLYDRLFDVPFPYSMGFHQAPVNTGVTNFHLHAHYYPPLLRSASIRKFMVGYELLAEPQRDITPESAAEMLRRNLDKISSGS
jgi:UDPglucose--hexose-1-phosphate uridylyltransferase